MSARRKPQAHDDGRRNADLARIHIAKKWATGALGMADGDYRALLADVMSEAGDVLPAGERPSARWLSAPGRRAVLRRFAGLGWPDAGRAERQIEESAPPRRQKGRTNGRYPVPSRGNMVSQPAADYLAHLEDLLDWTDDSSRLLGFISRQLDKPSMVASLTRAEATIVITGLEYVTGLKNPKTKAQHLRWGTVAQDERDRARRQREAGA